MILAASTGLRLLARSLITMPCANHQKIKFLLVKMSDGKVEEIIAYNELSDVIECQHEAELHLPDSASSRAFKEITAEHQGPLTYLTRGTTCWYTAMAAL
jgi:hypothetical protein